MSVQRVREMKEGKEGTEETCRLVYEAEGYHHISTRSSRIIWISTTERHIAEGKTLFVLNFIDSFFSS